MTHSMTGFARCEQEFPWGHLSCEIRSVNHRYLDPSFRLPDALRSTETTLRELLKHTIKRGKIEVAIFLRQEQNVGHSINAQALQNIAQLTATLNEHLPKTALLNPLEVLRWPGMLQAQELDTKELASAAHNLAQQTLVQLQKSRAREGQGLAEHIEHRLNLIRNHVATLRNQLPQLINAQQNKMQQKIAELNVEIDQDRLAQELVIIAQKADVAEELDRLDTHIKEAAHTLSQIGPKGRRLDFLMQEFNREANTLSSKAITSDVTQVAIELKVLIEQMREQVQNIE